MIHSRRIRDPIHGFIHLKDRECRIVDTPIFQRLRSIQQLALASLVYPGAVHTRFDHTLGVLHVADRMCGVLDIDSDHKDLIRFAALLHDLGHGPFSHVSEVVLDHLSPPGLEEKAGQKDKIHELITQQIIRTHRDLRELSDPERERIATLLNTGVDDPVNRQIISGPLDADKQDYLLRDSYFCGVSYGVFDLRQLHESLVRRDEDGFKLLMVEENGLHALEQFILAKYYLTTQVYRHKVRLIGDSMLVRGLELGVRSDNLQFLRDLYRYEHGSSEYLDNYLEWNDRRVTVELLENRNSKTLAGQMFRRLAERRLLKRIVGISLRELIADCGVTDFEHVFAGLRDELERAVHDELLRAGHINVSSEFVIAHHYRIENVRRQAANSEKAIRIARDHGVEDLETASTLFESIDEKLREDHLVILAPVAFEDERARTTVSRRIEELVLDFLRRKLEPQLSLNLTGKTP